MIITTTKSTTQKKNINIDEYINSNNSQIDL